MDLSGIGGERLQLRWISSAEGKLFADYVNQVNDIILELGRFDATAHHLALAAIKRTLSTPRVRWLLGMELELVENQNVYGVPVDQEKYKEVLGSAVTQEYQKALVLEILAEKEGQLVRQIAEKSGLDLLTISNCLVALEQEGLAEQSGHEGQHPKFVRQAA